MKKDTKIILSIGVVLLILFAIAGISASKPIPQMHILTPEGGHGLSVVSNESKLPLTNIKMVHLVNAPWARGEITRLPMNSKPFDLPVGATKEIDLAEGDDSSTDHEGIEATCDQGKIVLSQSAKL